MAQSRKCLLMLLLVVAYASTSSCEEASTNTVSASGLSFVVSMDCDGLDKVCVVSAFYNCSANAFNVQSAVQATCDGVTSGDPCWVSSFDTKILSDPCIGETKTLEVIYGCAKSKALCLQRLVSPASRG
ncbi:hypothetical protein BV898_15147 [Hypsibius exemplaris]|uniref:SUEL-type lectin domain-containing protein n=1 Tax=Hypsibius exemplaris TaxID=2072580 RepID=A0A9X6NAF2_HYPEX|nr:hypothetical protein BV898_15147 [Hypsibius exemplaris]